MKKVEVKIKYDDKKLEAIKFYMSKKNDDFEVELDEQIEKLYEKYVPQATREFLEASEIFSVKKEISKKTNNQKIVGTTVTMQNDTK